MRLTNHPDENMLAAFADRTLREKERLLVLGHLAGCASCRHLVVVTTTLSIAADSSNLSAVTQQSQFHLGYQLSAAIFVCLFAFAPLLDYSKVHVLETAERSRQAPASPRRVTETETATARPNGQPHRTIAIGLREHDDTYRASKGKEVAAGEPWRHWNFDLLPPVSASAFRGKASPQSLLFAELRFPATDPACAKPGINQIALNTSSGEKWITVAPLWIAK